MAVLAENLFPGDVLLAHPTSSFKMQPTSLTSRQQQQLGLLMGRGQHDVLEAARVAALLNGQSGSFSLQTGLGGAGLGSGVLAGLGGTSGGLNLSIGSLPHASQQPQTSQLVLPDQLALLSQFPHALLPQQYSSTDRDLQLTGLRNVGKTRSSDSRSSSAYASRHQAAEQRRRTRINERLELLRKLVPHAERANTACFLEEVIKYIEALKRRTLELEAMLEAATGKPVTKSLGAQGVTPAGASALTALEPMVTDSQAPSPRQAAPSSQQTSGPHPPSGSAAAAAASPVPLAPPLTQQQQSRAATQQQHESLTTAPHQASSGVGGGGGGGGSAAGAGPQHRSSPQVQLGSAVTSQLANLLPSMSMAQGQQHGGIGSLFPQSGGALSLGNGVLSLSGGGGALTLAQLTAGLHHSGTCGSTAIAAAGSNGLLSHSQSQLTSSSSHAATVTQQHLSDLHTMQMMHSLQQHHHRAAAAAAAAAASAGGGQHSLLPHSHSHHPPSFHPTNNKAFLHFNEDLFAGLKSEQLLPTRSLLGAASATPSNSLQVTSAHLPADSNTLLHGQVEWMRKTISGSPVSSEESGVPLKKRKVLLL